MPKPEESREEVFTAIHQRMNEVMCSLACVVRTLEVSAPADTDEDVCHARIALREVKRALDSVYNDLDQFSSDHLSKAEQAVAS